MGNFQRSRTSTFGTIDKEIARQKRWRELIQYLQPEILYELNCVYRSWNGSSYNKKPAKLVGYVRYFNSQSFQFELLASEAMPRTWKGQREDRKHWITFKFDEIDKEDIKPFNRNDLPLLLGMEFKSPLLEKELQKG